MTQAHRMVKLKKALFGPSMGQRSGLVGYRSNPAIDAVV